LASTTGTPLGFIEWDSVARGLAAADAMLKAAVVTPVVLRPVTPGRYFAVVSGDVEAVRASVAAGVLRGGESVIDQLVLPAPFPGIFPAVGGRTGALRLSAVGVIETLTLCTLFAAVDTAAKTGEVRVHDVRLAMGLGGKAFESSAVKWRTSKRRSSPPARWPPRAAPCSRRRSFRTPIPYSSRR